MTTTLAYPPLQRSIFWTIAFLITSSSTAVSTSRSRTHQWAPQYLGLSSKQCYKGSKGPKFWKRYIHDTSLIIKQDNLFAFQQLLNTTLSAISFTMEATAENQLHFLDLLMYKLPSEMFETSVYRKATNADIVLHYDSISPPRTKPHHMLGLSQCMRGPNWPTALCTCKST